MEETASAQQTKCGMRRFPQKMCEKKRFFSEKP